MKKITLLFSIYFVLFSVNAQQIQWANKLIKYSSDLGGKQNGIKRVLGKPDCFPQAGSSPNAWTPKKALDGYEWIEVSFEKPQTVKQVAVFENTNTGCVVKISVDTGSGKYETVWNRKEFWNPPKYRMTFATDRSYYFKRKRRKVQEAPEAVNPGIVYAILENAVANVIAVKVEFNFGLMPGQKQIDAIGISDSETPIEATINTSEIFENLPIAKTIALPEIVPTSPAISPDGKTLFITSINEEKSEIVSFVKESNGNWSKKMVETLLNTGEYYNHIEFVGNNFLLKGGSEHDSNIGETGNEIFTINNGQYQSAGKIKIAAYNNYDETETISITADQKVLIMGIETDFTQGGIDLYFAQRKEDGTYGFLQNMGKVINSAADEGTCQLLSDTKTMLFCSDGFSGYGSYDIYVSYRLDDTWKNWSEPINLGSKINSFEPEGVPYYDETFEELYFVTSVDGNNVLKSIAIPKSSLMKK
jgi:WD40-like Beta Propeller Repeat